MKSAHFSLLCVLSLSATLLVSLSSRVSRAAPIEDVGEATEVVKATRLWTEPTRFGEAIAVLDPGLKVRVLSYVMTRGWIKVETPSGREGWIPMRNTALAGRRSTSLIPSQIAQAEVGRRRPASTEGANDTPDGSADPNDLSTADQQLTDNEPPPPQTAPAVSKADTNKRKAKTLKLPLEPKPAEFESPWQIGFGLEYANQVNLGRASGVGIHAHLARQVAATDSTKFSLGLGLDWNFYSETSADAALDTQVYRGTQIILPHVLGKFAMSNWGLDLELGLQLDRTRISTTQISTGSEIATSGGKLASGSVSEKGVGFIVSPSYRHDFSSSFAMEFYLKYGFGVTMTNESAVFVGDTSQQVAHTLGIGVRVLGGL